MSKARENDLKWKDGRAFSLIYYPGEEYEALIKQAYNLFFSENALNPMCFPSLKRFEAEVIGMIGTLMHGDEHCRGSFTSGGTESILMAMKTARDYALKTLPEITVPEVILPTTAHPAIVKGLDLLGMKGVFVEVDKEFKADTPKTEKAIGKNTVLLVGSAPSFPHGVIDPIAQLSDLAVKHNLLLHIDACIGGMMLPFLRKQGYPVPPFDFELPGVSSISVDLHKYGYAAKGASVILYKNAALRKHQFTVYTKWPGGIYGSPTITGSRPGATVAAAWAALMGIGENGYLDFAERTMTATNKIKKAIEKNKDLYVLGNPDMSLIAFTSDTVDIFEIADELGISGWYFERMQKPEAIHLTISQIHHDVIDDFIIDLNMAVKKAKSFSLRKAAGAVQTEVIKRLIKILPEGVISKVQAQFSGNAEKSERTAPIYGVLGALHGSDDLDEIVRNLLDKINAPEEGDSKMGNER